MAFLGDTTDDDFHQARGTVGVLSVDIRDIAARWRTLLALGLISLAAGVLAIALPQIATFTASIVIGWLLIVDGLVQGVHAWQIRGRRGTMLNAVTGLVALGAGVLLLVFPAAGILTLTLVLAIAFLAGGALRSVWAFQLRPLSGWGWLLASGVLSLALGVTAMMLFPDVAGWLLGLFLGVNLLASGWWTVMMAIAGRRWKQEHAET